MGTLIEQMLEAFSKHLVVGPQLVSYTLTISYYNQMSPGIAKYKLCCLCELVSEVSRLAVHIMELLSCASAIALYF